MPMRTHPHGGAALFPLSRVTLLQESCVYRHIRIHTGGTLAAELRVYARGSVPSAPHEPPSPHPPVGLETSTYAPHSLDRRQKNLLIATMSLVYDEPL